MVLGASVSVVCSVCREGLSLTAGGFYAGWEVTKQIDPIGHNNFLTPSLRSYVRNLCRQEAVDELLQANKTNLIFTGKYHVVATRPSVRIVVP